MTGLNTPAVCTPFMPIGEIASAFLDQLEANARRAQAGRALVDAAMSCGPDAVRFLEILHSELLPGAPLPNPYGLMAEAREWARIASTGENKAYALACFEALPDAERAGFLAHVSMRVAA